MCKGRRGPVRDGVMRHRYPLWGLAMIVAVALALAGCSSWFTGTPPGTRVASSSSTDWAARTVVGYVPYWDQERAFDVARKHLEVFDQISPMWYSLDAKGNIVLADAKHTHIDPAEVHYLQNQGIQVIPTIANLRNGKWTYKPVHKVLHDPALRETHIRNIVNLAVRAGYDGIDVDYESLQSEDREAYSTFMRELGKALDAKGKLLTTSVHPKQSEPGPYEHNKAQDYRAIGAAADQVRVMTYDYHWSTSEPGPVAPVDWVEDVISWTVTQIPKDKVVLGAVLLGYDWVDGGQGETVSYQKAMSLAREHDASIARKGPGRSPWFTYTDARGRGHEVWFEDAQSVEAKLGLVQKYDLGGVFFWRLGGADERVWTLVQPSEVARSQARHRSVHRTESGPATVVPAP